MLYHNTVLYYMILYCIILCWDLDSIWAIGAQPVHAIGNLTGNNRVVYRRSIRPKTGRSPASIVSRHPVVYNLAW